MKVSFWLARRMASVTASDVFAAEKAGSRLTGVVSMLLSGNTSRMAGRHSRSAKLVSSAMTPRASRPGRARTSQLKEQVRGTMLGALPPSMRPTPMVE